MPLALFPRVHPCRLCQSEPLLIRSGPDLWVAEAGNHSIAPGFATAQGSWPGTVCPNKLGGFHRPRVPPTESPMCVKGQFGVDGDAARHDMNGPLEISRADSY